MLSREHARTWTSSDGMQASAITAECRDLEPKMGPEGGEAEKRHRNSVKPELLPIALLALPYPLPRGLPVLPAAFKALGAAPLLTRSENPATTAVRGAPCWDQAHPVFLSLLLIPGPPACTLDSLLFYILSASCSQRAPTLTFARDP